MKRKDASELDMALKKPGLKSKHLSTENFNKLIPIGRTLGRYLDEMGEDEKKVFDAYDIGITQQGPVFPEGISKDERKAFNSKMDKIHEKDFTPTKPNGGDPLEFNFIPLEEFRKWTEEVDTGVALVLAEFLLKEA